MNIEKNEMSWIISSIVVECLSRDNSLSSAFDDAVLAYWINEYPAIKYLRTVFTAIDHEIALGYCEDKTNNEITKGVQSIVRIALDDLNQ